jgi:hypothetical protein
MSPWDVRIFGGLFVGIPAALGIGAVLENLHKRNRVVAPYLWFTNSLSAIV